MIVEYLNEGTASMGQVLALLGGRSSPGFYFTLMINLTLMQLLVWSMARHSSDIDVWRTAAVCVVVGVAMLMGAGAGTLGGIIGAGLVAMLLGWIFLGYVFDLENWQRIVMAAVGPIAAVLSYLVGHWLEAVIFGSGILLR